MQDDEWQILVFLQISPRIPMGPQPSQPQTAELFRPRLDELLNMLHPLIGLAALIDRCEIECNFSTSFTSGRGGRRCATDAAQHYKNDSC